MELSPQKVSRDLIEWRSRLEGPDGLLLLLVLMFFMFSVITVFIAVNLISLILVSGRVSGAESTKRSTMVLLNGRTGSRGLMA